MSHSHEQQPLLPSTMRAFVACSAFEFGGDRGPGGNGGGIVAFKYPRKGLRGCCARPFECAVVRLTRESLLVYRPTEPGLHAELSWRNVRKRRRHVSRKGDRVSYDFAFFTHSDILLLEVEDALTADGITAALRLLNMADASFASPVQDAVQWLVQNRPLPVPSVGCRSPPALTTRVPVIQREDPRGEALRRIRMREEEMREAIFYVPPRRSYATSLGTERRLKTRSPPRGSSSPAPRPNSQPPPRHIAAGTSADVGAPPLPRSASYSLGGEIARQSGAETASEMRELLHLLEQEEKKTTVLLESQEMRIRALRLMEETDAPLSLRQQAMTISGAHFSCNGQQKTRTESQEMGGKEAIQTVCDGSYASHERPPLALREIQPSPHRDQHQELSLYTQKPSSGSVMPTDDDVKCEAVTPASTSLGTHNGSNEELNGAHRMGPQHKTEQQRQQQLPVDGLSDSEALAREELCLELSNGKEEAATTESQPLVKRNPSHAVASAATKAVEAYSATKAEGGGVLCGNWEEPRQREAGRTFDSRTATQEARGEPPSEALEEKKGGAAPQREQQEVQEGIAAKTKGALRVCGTWKEYRDANSGRLYYVNTETKQRTWKIKETPFANE
ncbi:hypothetical protein BCY84_11383 [Trypanosoma cruzi cruzi]|nr:hypothetical protein BCY84_11383 [Trypanosoma cruzi cruzi]